jgi:hypothetical protein
MDQFKKGGRGDDRQQYLNLWDGDPIIIDRKSDVQREGAPLVVNHPFVCIIGTLQPDVVKTMRGERRGGGPPPNDGLLDRFLFSWPAELPAVGEQWREVRPGVIKRWAAVVEALLALSMKMDAKKGKGFVFGPRPWVVKLSKCGRQAWKEFTDAHAEEMNDKDLPEHLFGPWAKLRGYCARLALIVHYLHWACGKSEKESDVDGASVRRGAVLVDYFKSHVRKVHVGIEVDPRVSLARLVLGWIVREGRETFKRHEAYSDLKSLGRVPSPSSLDAPLELLAELHYIRAQDPQQKPARGRPPATPYLVNPRVLQDHPDNPVNPVKGGSP